MKSIIFGNATVTILDSLYITIVSISMVFFILILISFLLSLFKYIPQEKIFTEKKQKVDNKKNIVKNENGIKPEDIKDERMLVALMVAAMECASENENSYIKVRSIKEI